MVCLKLGFAKDQFSFVFLMFNSAKQWFKHIYATKHIYIYIKHLLNNITFVKNRNVISSAMTFLSGIVTFPLKLSEVTNNHHNHSSHEETGLELSDLSDGDKPGLEPMFSTPSPQSSFHSQHLVQF